MSLPDGLRDLPDRLLHNCKAVLELPPLSQARCTTKTKRQIRNKYFGLLKHFKHLPLELYHRQDC